MSVSLFLLLWIPCYHLSSTSKHEGEMKPQRGRSRLYILVKETYPITPEKPRVRPFCSGGGAFPKKTLLAPVVVWRLAVAHGYGGIMLGLLGRLVMTAIFLLNLAWTCPYWPPVPPCFNPARGEQGDIPTDNEGVSYGQRRKQVTGFEKAKIRRHTACGFFYKNYQ